MKENRGKIIRKENVKSEGNIIKKKVKEKKGNKEDGQKNMTNEKTRE